MPPLRALPSQSLRPAWSPGELCRAATTAAGLPHTHNFQTAGTRPFTSTPDKADANAGESDGPSQGIADDTGKSLPPIRKGWQVVDQHGVRFQVGDRSDVVKRRWKNRKRRPAASPVRALWIKPNDRLERLAKMGSSLDSRITRQDGGRIGAITKDTIMDDSTWHRLKQGLTEVAESDTASVKWRKVYEDEGLGSEKGKEMSPSSQQKRHGDRRDHEGETLQTGTTGIEPDVKAQGREPGPKEPEPKPDPVSVRERLRDAIGNIRSTLSAELEVYERPSRYRRDAPAAPKSIQEERLDELEALLIQASRHLRELRGYSDTPKETEDTSQDLHRPIRYLSKDPTRPLPHTTGQAIPPALFGPQGRLVRPSTNEEKSQPEKPQSSHLADDLSEEIGDSLSSLEASEVETRKRDVKLEDELFSADLSKPQKNSGSLLGELFPELEGNSRGAQQRSGNEREVPRLSLDFQEQKQERRSRLLGRKEFIDRQMQAMYLDTLVVVKLSGLSKYLHEEDIKRLVPSSSKYIEGWTDPNFITAFPARNEQTLERVDQYYVLFRNVRSARDFQEHVRKLHLTVKSHAPSSLSSPLPPPPGYTNDKGVDLYTALHSYTIGPPISNRIFCSIVPTPYPRNLRAAFLAGGYESIVPPNSNLANPDSAAAASHEPTPAKVLFHVEGAQPSLVELRNTIARDGKDRWLPWAIVGGTNGPEGVVRLVSHYARNEAVGDNAEALMVRKIPPRYIITFENKAEAVRFVRRWHRMPFKWNVGGVYEDGEGPPQARAELLW